MNHIKALAEIVNTIRRHNSLDKVNVSLNSDFREDLGLDSFDLAELTVMIEDKFGVDIFETGIVRTIGDALVKINQSVTE